MDFGNGLYFWNTIPMCFLSSMGSTSFELMFWPMTSICPVVIMEVSTRSFMRLIQRRRVDFPHPDGPMNEVTFFSGMSSEMFLRTSVLPLSYENETLLILIMMK